MRRFLDFLQALGAVFFRFGKLQTMIFRYFRRSGPSRVPISKIFEICMISDTFPRRNPTFILRPREHFAPDFGVMIFDAFSRRHVSSLFYVFGALRWPDAMIFETLLMTFFATL